MRRRETGGIKALKGSKFCSRSRAVGPHLRRELRPRWEQLPPGWRLQPFPDPAQRVDMFILGLSPSLLFSIKYKI